MNRFIFIWDIRLCGLKKLNYS